MKDDKGKILIVDDNEELLLALRMFLSQHFSKIEILRNPNQISAKLESEDFDLILLDMNFSPGQTSGNEGIYWMNRILEQDPEAGIVFITAYGDVELAVRAMHEGALDFIEKSWNDSKILSTILSAKKLGKTRLEVKKLREKQKHLSDRIHHDYRLIPPESASMKKILETVDKVAGTDANVLILGENGTGKEVIAREIHHRSKRAGEVFINVDLGSLPENLFESELFGHVAGAFTDAKQDRTGRFEIASGGTLYLDEIGNLPLNLQSKILSAIQNHEITRIGSSKPMHIDIRLICATNKPLYDMVDRGQFREDLLYRINTIQIDIPPLRERIEDIPSLVAFFLEEFSDRYRGSWMKISRPAMEKLKKHNWFGNIRELRHTIEKAVILTDGSTLTPSDIIFYTKSPAREESEILNLEENEKRIISLALSRCNENISLTAKKLGINRSTLYDKMKKYGLQ
ncbi:MAG: AAA family ATPase [Bacteroides sp. SM23_62_1]|nr:MAG: AAA family ATPase [Bacteroides sp. SM23_62_1]